MPQRRVLKADNSSDKAARHEASAGAPSESAPERVSVVATVRNEADSIEVFLEALLAQTRPADEIVIVDGGSTDGTVEVLERVAEREPRLQIQRTPGASISRGRNDAIEAAAGPVIAVTDAGTIAERDWLGNLVRPFEADPQVDVVAGFFVAGGRTWFERTLSTLITTQVQEVDAERFLPSSRSVAFRKDWWQRVGGYPEWLRHGEDVVFDLELRRAGAKFEFVPDARVAWHARSTLRLYFRQYFNYGRAEGRAALFLNRNAARYASYAAGAWLLRRSRRERLPLILLGAGMGIHFARFYGRLWRQPPALSARGVAAAHAFTPFVVVAGDVAKMIGFPVGVVQRLQAVGAGTHEVVGRCPACGGPLVQWRDVDGGEPSDTSTYRLLRCDACGSAVTAGDPPLEDAYEGGMYNPSSVLAPLVEHLQLAAMRQPVRLLRGAGGKPGGRVLDVGAGRGRLVAVLRRAGFDATGIEPSQLSASIAARRGLPIERVGIDEHTETGLDAVVLWHVLEHVDDPVAALRRVRGWLRPGALLLVGVPNPDSLQARIGGRAWLHFDVPRHRTHFTPAGLTRALERGGFEVERIEHLVWQQNPLGMWLAILTRLGMRPNLPLHVVKRTVKPTPREVVALVAGVALVPAAIAVELLAAAAGRGGTIAALGRVQDRAKKFVT
jgi:glycosyltransferase involved in cell wall biosynthesis/SAM-dependent methyltransferase